MNWYSSTTHKIGIMPWLFTLNWLIQISIISGLGLLYFQVKRGSNLQIDLETLRLGVALGVLSFLLSIVYALSISQILHRLLCVRVVDYFVSLLQLVVNRVEAFCQETCRYSRHMDTILFLQNGFNRSLVLYLFLFWFGRISV